MQVFRTENHSPTVALPETGILTPDGDLFHHAEPRALLPVHYERLAEHGINAATRRIFSEDEISRIRSNWEAFRKEYDLGESDILRLVGFGLSNSERQLLSEENKARKSFVRTSRFWPRICNGLKTRSAQAVLRRIIDMFDPYVDKKYLSEADKLSTIQLYRSTGSYLQVARAVQRSSATVRSFIFEYRRRTKFSFSERRVLWNTVAALFPEHFKAHRVPLASEIKWTLVCKTFIRNQGTLSREWQKMTSELEDLMSAGKTLEEALEVVAPICPHISPAQLSDFIGLILQEYPLIETLSRKSIGERHIAEIMRRQGVSGFLAKRYSDFKFCRYRIGEILTNVRRRFLEPARLRLSLRSQLALISRSLRTLPKPSEGQRIRLSTVHVLRQLISMQTERCPEWRPRRKLRDYITKYG